jgi:hypothetical protein
MAKPRARPGAEARVTIGWREWVALDTLRLPAIKAKIDTGARTSALHAFYVEPIEVGGRQRVRFGIHPLQGRTDIEVHCVADAVDYRQVTDSGGHREQRWVIAAPIRLGDRVWPIEITLTNRDDMMFRMLVGRTAMGRRLVVDPGRSYVLGQADAGVYPPPPRRHRAAKKRKAPTGSRR